MSTIVFKLQVLANLLRCGKRKPSGNGAGGAEDQVTEKSGMTDIPNDTNLYETTLGKASPKTDFADEATTDGPSDGSDSEGSSVDASMATQQATPPILLPPGLEDTTRAGRVGLPNSVPSDLNEVLKKLSPQDAMTVLARFELKRFAQLFPEEVAAGETQKTSMSGGAKQKQREAERPALGAKEEVAHNPRNHQTNDMCGVPKPEEVLSLLNKSQQKKGRATENCDATKIYDVPPRGKPPDCQTDDTAGSLRSNLQKMLLIDSSCIFMARKIKPLGLNSPKALWGYFQQFGPIEDVFVTHSLNKEDPSQTRPAGVAFIAMKNAEDVLKVLQQEHVIRRVRIDVLKYEHRQRK